MFDKTRQWNKMTAQKLAFSKRLDAPSELWKIIFSPEVLAICGYMQQLH
jgi:hypothetical protein